VTEPQVAANPDAAVSLEFAELASDEPIAKAAAALERNGIRVAPRRYRTACAIVSSGNVGRLRVSSSGMRPP
jgi:hypothetical protein